MDDINDAVKAILGPYQHQKDKEIIIPDSVKNCVDFERFMRKEMTMLYKDVDKNNYDTFNYKFILHMHSEKLGIDDCAWTRNSNISRWNRMGYDETKPFFWIEAIPDNYNNIIKVGDNDIVKSVFNFFMPDKAYTRSQKYKEYINMYKNRPAINVYVKDA